MVAWRAAPSVRAVLDEANRRWPNRNRTADGIIGDPAHSARISDHNPDARGIVHAVDLTHDPAHGVDCAALAERLRRDRDPRIKYVIWHGRLFRGAWSDGVREGKSAPWAWERYIGPSPHDHHMHISVGSGAGPENDTSAWFGSAASTAREDDDMPTLEEFEDAAYKGAKKALNEGVAPGQTSGAGTMRATLVTLQALVNELRTRDGALSQKVGDGNAAILGAVAALDTADLSDEDKAEIVEGLGAYAAEHGITIDTSGLLDALHARLAA